MSAPTLTPAPIEAQVDLRFEPGTIKPSGGVQVMVVYAQHACRWCGQHECETRDEHDTTLHQSETYWRSSEAARHECPACLDSVFDGQHCVSVSTAPIGGTR